MATSENHTKYIHDHPAQEQVKKYLLLINQLFILFSELWNCPWWIQRAAKQFKCQRRGTFRNWKLFRTEYTSAGPTYRSASSQNKHSQEIEQENKVQTSYWWAVASYEAIRIWTIAWPKLLVFREACNQQIELYEENRCR